VLMLHYLTIYKYKYITIAICIDTSIFMSI
jgi:hypothetical protein